MPSAYGRDKNAKNSVWLLQKQIPIVIHIAAKLRKWSAINYKSSTGLGIKTEDQTHNHNQSTSLLR